MRYTLLIFLLFSAFLYSCQKQNDLKKGIWRAEIPTSIGVLPFQILIDSNSHAFILNADEKLPFDSLYFENDSLHIRQDIFDSEIIAKVSGDNMEGRFVKLAGDLSTKVGRFSANYNDLDRFKTSKQQAKHNVTGKYEVVFFDGESSYEALGVFTQTNDKVKGTFLTTTGDYRFLEGNVVGDSLKLSTFDGNHVYLFSAKIVGDSLVGGRFCSNMKYIELWKALKNPKAELPDANTLTFMKSGQKSLNFSFNNTKGKTISINDARYKNKVVLVQVLGSWCPNCMDETQFLSQYLKKNPHKNLEVIGLAFEKSIDPEFAYPRIERLKKRFDVNYEILLAGTNDKKDASSKLPQLSSILSFPTTIYIDKKGNVRKIHTGFSGPGTGQYYEKWVKEFELFIEKLEKE